MLSEDNCHLFDQHRQSMKTHLFGPERSSIQVVAKQLEDDLKKKQSVSFKDEDDIFIVENWKEYNVDVSSSNFLQKQKQKSNSQCFNICTTF
ncbi:unnamed protein product (macronuclear) [Paramecium tetraurelia]|uniref:Uncharacterized protein n=1 Tax=Paramecium tetraurelia TaxID=5888 RepID=A0DEJ6_PARTE|nr:uncharacterized protein GSPATT00016289001 [Paramecium tetraurelia]CAK81463.1 unnamed protein product [Paramecium tetraurelia]|eukprot:XP_001448860.1 hypothetical protein (macronuclear) [Paramecium tetraurelia strain d4-2]